MPLAGTGLVDLHVELETDLFFRRGLCRAVFLGIFFTGIDFGGAHGWAWEGNVCCGGGFELWRIRLRKTTLATNEFGGWTPPVLQRGKQERVIGLEPTTATLA